MGTGAGFVAHCFTPAPQLLANCRWSRENGGRAVVKRTEQPEQANLGELLRTIARDGRELLVEQLELFRAEVGQQLRQAGVSAAEVAAGGGLTAAGGLLTGFMAAHL